MAPGTASCRPVSDPTSIGGGPGRTKRSIRSRDRSRCAGVSAIAGAAPDPLACRVRPLIDNTQLGRQEARLLDAAFLPSS
ncbi:MAG: hypothetical protein AAFV86_04075, partial [Pseudomonadota bacterium]